MFHETHTQTDNSIQLLKPTHLNKPTDTHWTENCKHRDKHTSTIPPDLSGFSPKLTTTAQNKIG